MSEEERDAFQRSSHLGVIGGYSFYEHLVCTRLLSLQECEKLTAEVHEQAPQLVKGRMVIAASTNLRKLFLLDPTTGGIELLQTVRGGSPHFCAPGPQDGYLAWLEEHSLRLERDEYRWDELLPGEPDSKGIVLFPERGEMATVGEMRGVEVRSSALFVPEHPNAGWAYSLRLRLQPGSSEEERGFKTCQLHMRHWEITDAHGEVRRVSGEGVVGKMPVLHDGGYTDKGPAGDGNPYEGIFVYQSCSGMMEGGGTFGGRIVLVPGELNAPDQTPEITLPVPAFPLSIPDFIF